jgi:NADP-dependent 3-hydroxy acid dehydrogenase YdfG
MKKTILVCGHGPGISDAVARKFGKEGWNVAIVARNADRLASAAKSLVDAGVHAKAFPCQLGDAAAVKQLVRDVSAALGPVSTVHWNVYGGGGGDLLTASPDDLRAAFDINVGGLIAAVQAALPGLKEAAGSVLVTGGGFAFYNPEVDKMATAYGAAGLAVGKAAQHKTTGLLRERLAKEGVFVGEVVVLGMVKGTAFDGGQATLEASDIAAKFWKLEQERSESSVTFG